MISNFIFQVIDTFNNTKIFPSSIFPHNKQTTSIDVWRIDINDKMFKTF